MDDNMSTGISGADQGMWMVLKKVQKLQNYDVLRYFWAVLELVSLFILCSSCVQ